MHYLSKSTRWLEVRSTNKEIKQRKRFSRDKEFKKRKIKKKGETRDGQVRSMFTNGANNSFEASILEEQSIIIPDENRKWKFPCDCKIRRKSVKEWVKTLINYGIGIHLKNQNFFTNKQMFDFLKQKN